MSVFDIIAHSFQVDGAEYMWAILIMLALALALCIERVYYIFTKCSKGRDKFMVEVASLLRGGKVEDAGRLAAMFTFPLARVVSAILNNKDKGQSGMQRAVDEVYLTEAPRINRYLGTIVSVANVATLLGLIGTIYGLIGSFNAVANLPAAERPKALADGIAIAMATTYFGLIVAIPSLFVHAILTSQADKLNEELEEKSAKVMNLIA